MKTIGSKKILFIGDSHTVLSFGDRWRDHLSVEYKESLQLHQYAVSGSHLLHWMTGDLKNLTIRNLKYVTGSSLEKSAEPLDLNILNLIQSIQPEELFIALGTNDVLFLEDQFRGDRYQKALSSLSNRHPDLFWVLPPRLKEDIASQSTQDEFKSVINQKFYRVLTSEKFSPDQNDGVHFTRDRAIQWADEIWNQYLHFTKKY